MAMKSTNAPVNRDPFSKVEFDGIMQKELMQSQNDEAFKQLKAEI